MRSDVRACVCGWETRAHSYAHMCARADGAWTMPMFLTSPPIQADINTIDCNWAVMCGI